MLKGSNAAEIFWRTKMGKYDDIINLPHHTSKTRPRMAAADRAAQFSPFAALTGYDDAVKETSRHTNEKRELSDDEKEELDRKLQLIRDKLYDDLPKAEFLYFVPDEKKEGGSYLTASGLVKKIDEIERIIVMQNGVNINIDDIMDLKLL